MPPVIVGVAAGVAAAGVVSTAAAIAIGVAATALTYAVTPEFGAGSFSNEAYAQQQMLRSPAEPRRGVYGRAMVSGPLIFAEETGTDNEFLHLVIALAGHRCDAIETVYFGDEVAWTVSGGINSKFASHARIKPHLGDQTAADSQLLSDCSAWTSKHVGHGVTYLYVRLKYDVDVFPNGVPNIKALVRGKPVYDPRLDSSNGGSGTHRFNDPNTWQWTDNWALCVLDYTRFESGVGATETEIDLPTYALAAHDSDEFVEYQTDEWERRYSCNGTYTQDASPASILEKMLTAGAGMQVYVGGQYQLYAGVYQGPEVLTLTEDDCAGDVDISPYTSRSELCNAVRGTFVDPDSFYQPTDFTPYESAYYRGQDNGEYIDHDIDLPFTQSSWTAQRLAKLHLELNRAGMQITFPTKMIGLAVSVGKVVRLQLPSLGINQTFMVADWQFDFGRPVKLILRETNADIFEFDKGSYTQRDLAPNTTLPDPSKVPTVSGVVWVPSGDDANWLGELSWNAPGSNSAYRYRLEVVNQQQEVVYQASIEGTRHHVPKLDAGTYNLYLWAVNLFSNRSNIPASMTIGADAPPPVNGILADIGALSLTLRPQTAAVIAATTEFEVKGSLNTVLNNADYLGQGKEVLWPNRHPNTLYYVWARSVNNYGFGAWFGPVGIQTSTDNSAIVQLIGTAFDKFTWFAWANDNAGSGFTTVEAQGEGKDYLGVATEKKTSVPSGNWQDYTWTKIKTEIPDVFTPEEQTQLDNLMAGKLPAGDKDMLAAQDALNNPALANDLLTSLALLNNGIDAASLNGETPAGAQSKANTAQSAAEAYALAKANLAETTAKAHADGKVTAEETRAIADAQAKADAAKAQAINTASSDATTKANNAQVAAQSYALAKASLAETTAKAYADDVVSDEETRAIADAQIRANTAKVQAIATAANDATTKANNAEANAALDALNKANSAREAALASPLLRNESYYRTLSDFFFEYGVAAYSDTYTGPSDDLNSLLPGSIYSVVKAGEHGGNVLRVTGSRWAYGIGLIPIDTNKKYKMRFKVRQHDDGTGARRVYAGVVTLDKNLNFISGGAGTHRYCAAAGISISNADGWNVFEGYITGEGDSSHAQFRPGTAYIRLMCIVNYSGGDGSADIDELSFYEITDKEDLIDIGMETSINAQAKADAAKNLAISTAAIDANNKSNNAQNAAQSYALAKANLAETTAKSYADSKVTAEEARAISDAQSKADVAKSQAITVAASDATTKANSAQVVSQNYALAKANLAETTAKAYADLKVTAEESRAIADAQAKADAAKLAAINESNTALDARINAGEATGLDNLLSGAGLPYRKDLIIYGDSNKYYPVVFASGDQNVNRRIKIWRAYNEQGPDDWNISTHKGQLNIDWFGNFGGWGGAGYFDQLLSHTWMYAPLLADAYRFGANIYYCFMLRGGGPNGAVYHFASDLNSLPNVYYNQETLNSGAGAYAAAPSMVINEERINNLKLGNANFNNLLAYSAQFNQLKSKFGSFGGLTADTIATLAIATNHLQAGAVTSDKITADIALIQKLVSNQGLFNQLQAQLGIFGGLSANSIASKAITTDKLHVLSRNLVNNFSSTGESTGWTTFPLVDHYHNGQDIKAMEVTTTGDAIAYSDAFDIDNTKVYEVNFTIYKLAGGGAGTRFFGMYADNGSVIDYYDSSRTINNANSPNFYFWSGALNNGQTMQLRAYIVGSEVDIAAVPNGLNISNICKLKPGCKRVGLRALNFYNNGTTSTDRWINPSVTELGGGQLSANQIVGNTALFNQLKTKIAQFGGLTANEILADSALINKLVATSALFNSLQARLAVFGGLTANSISSDAILGRHIKAGETIESPVIIGGQYQLIGSNTMKIESETPFGPDGLIEWRGPKLILNGQPNWSLIRKSNATRWTDSTGNEYFGGSLSAGVLKTGVTNPDKNAYAANSFPVVIGPFGSGGKAKTVVVSFDYDASWNSTSSVSSTAPKLSWQLQRKIGSGGWATVSSGTFTGSINSTYEAEIGRYLVSEFCSGSSTFTDTSTSTSDFSYQLKVISQTRYSVTSNVNNQKLTVISTE